MIPRSEGRLPVVIGLAGGVLVAAVLVGAVVAAVQQRTRARAERRERLERQIAAGRALFQEGRAGERELTGLIGADRIPLGGELVACARCHGERGGGARGGEAAPPIRGSALFAAVVSGSGDRPARPAYDLDTIERALREGRSSSGRALSWVMPRFELSRDQVESVVAYLRTLDDASAPGVAPNAVVIGAVLPRTGHLAAVSAEVEAVLRAAFSEVNEGGGVYGRRIELEVVDPEHAAARPTDVSGRVLALASNVYPAPRLDERLAAELGVPVVAPVGLEATASTLPIFTIHPGHFAQARWATQQLGPDASIAIVHSADSTGRAWAAGSSEERSRHGLASPPSLELAPGSVSGAPLRDWLAQAGTAEVLVAVPARLFPTVVRAAGVRTRFVAPASLARPDLGLTADEAARVRFVYPAEAGSANGGAPSALLELLGRHQLRPGAVAFQANALAAARLTIEALRRAGRDVSRASFVAALEELQDFETGVAPPLTFGQGNHIGVQGARWVHLDVAQRRLVAASEWVARTP